MTAPEITGATRLFAVLGDPVTQVQAPRLVNAMFGQLGAAAVLVPVQVRPGHLAEVVRGLQRVGNLDGLLVTVPHKVAVCGLADQLSATVLAAGSANALRREPDGTWSAENFDGTGFVAGLRHAGHTIADARVTLVGAGGAGAAIAVALLDAGVGRLAVYDADAARLRSLCRRLEAYRPGVAHGSRAPELSNVDIAINATPLGLRPDDPLPFVVPAAPRMVVADIIMHPERTALLRTAAAGGHDVHPGIHMLSCQIESYRTFFRLG